MQKRNKIKVLLCSPYGKKVGGIQRWTGHILNYYNKHETNVELKQFYPNKGGAYQNTSFLARLYLGIKSYLPFLADLQKELKTNQYDVVHFASSASLSLVRDIISLKIARRRGVKTIVHFHFGRIPELYEKQNWEQKLLHCVINLTDKTVVIDQASYYILNKQGYNNIELLPNPLTPQVAEIIKINSNIEKKDRKIVFAGHVVRTKGVFELVEACKGIENIKLKMIGYVTDDIKGKIKEEAGEDNESWLEIAGEQSFENTIKEMLSAAVFVLPTYTEGFPNVIIESMACGCPIVTTCVGAIPEMLDIKNGNNHGICVEPKNVKALKESIQIMLNNREYALECGKNAQRRVNELYSMSKVWNQLEVIWST